MLTNKQLFLLKVIGKLNYVDIDSLKILGFGKTTINKLLKAKLITKIVNNPNDIPSLYTLTNKGRFLFKEYTEEKISLSRSIEHDYYHTKNVIRCLSFDNIDSYKNERFIRAMFKEQIKEIEVKYNIKVSCPDCCIIIDDKLVYIETYLGYSAKRIQEKINFTLVDPMVDLVIFRKNNNLICKAKGGEKHD